MACTRTTLGLTLICFILILHEVEICSSRQFMVGANMIDCGEKCEYRCSKASRNKMCIRACNTCCQRCNCVPLGTSGNYDECPCYWHLTAHGGTRKCP